MNKPRINPDFDRLSDLVYLSSLEKLEAAIRDEGHTDSELSEALSEIIADLEAAIKNINAEISQLESDRADLRARRRLLLKVKQQVK